MFENLAAPAIPMPSRGASIMPFDLDMLKMDTGYGMCTNGKIDVVVGEKKSFGVRGQGTGSSMGYKYPVEVEGSCAAKYITVNVFPKDPMFDQATDTFVLSVTAEAAQMVALEHMTLDVSNSQQNIQMESDEVYRQFF